MINYILTLAIIFTGSLVINSIINGIGEYFSKKWDYTETLIYFSSFILTIGIICMAYNGKEPTYIFGFNLINILTAWCFWMVIFNADKDGFLLSIVCAVITLFFVAAINQMVEGFTGNILKSYWLSVFFFIASIIVRILVEKYEVVLRNRLPEFVVDGMMIMQEHPKGNRARG